MKEKELRRMSRGELLQLLIDRTREIEHLQTQLSQAQGEFAHTRAELADRSIAIEKAGSIAEAAIRVNKVFEDAQKAADDYLNGIRRLRQEQEKTCEKLIDEAKKKAEEIIAQAREKGEKMEQETQRRCEEMRLTAEKDARRNWDEMDRRLEQLSSDNAALREMLSGGKKRKWL